MKKLIALLALFSALSVPVAAQDGLNPTSEQLDQALQLLKKGGFDTSKLPNKGELQKMRSGENGRRVREMAKKMQEQNPEQFEQMQQKLLERFDRNGDGTFDPRERELAQQAFQQRQNDRSDKAPGDRPQPGDRVLNRFDYNDDGQLGPRERNAANEAWQRHQQSNDQNVIRLKRRVDESQSRRPDTAKRDDSHRNGAPRQASDRGPRPDDASANRSSRPSGRQAQPSRTNNDLRQRHSHQTSNSNGPPTNHSASGRGPHSTGGENRGGGGGASRGGGAPRGHR